MSYEGVMHTESAGDITTSGKGNGIFSREEWSGLCSSLSLSTRQEQILSCLFHDMSDAQIARKLNIAIPTVRTHMGRMFEKLGAEDRLGLVLLVVSTFRQQCRQQGCPRQR